jgi:hypothetical protein
MMKVRSLSLGLFSLLSSSIQAKDLIIRPADGYFLCPTVDLICQVINCETGGCDIINNGFEVSDVNGVKVYKALKEGANLSILGGDDTTEVACQQECQCQHIYLNTGCNVPEAQEAAEKEDSRTQAEYIMSVATVNQVSNQQVSNEQETPAQETVQPAAPDATQDRQVNVIISEQDNSSATAKSLGLAAILLALSSLWM